MANPFGMTEFSVPQLIGLDMQTKNNRVEQLYRQRQMDLQDKQIAKQDDAEKLAKTVGTQAASGDMAGAQKAALSGGNFDLANAITKMDENQRAQVKVKNDEVGNALKWADTPEKWNQAVDALSQNGHPEVAQYRDHFDKRAEFAIHINQIDKLIKEASGVVAGPGSQLLDKDTGRVMASVPDRATYHTLGADQTLVQTGGNGGSSSIGGGGPAVRNNNPGNIRDSDWAHGQPGYQGADPQGFAIFAPGAGEQAQSALLHSYIARGYDTPLKIASRWAPAGDGANDPNAYAAHIAHDLGINPTDKVTPQQINQIAQTITRVETGGSSGGGTGGAHVVATGSNVNSSLEAPTLSDPSIHGEAYLSKIPPETATQVKALADGRLAFPSGFALKTPYWQNMLKAVGQYDPQFDAVNYNARSKTRGDFTSGKSAQNIKSLNTAIGHLGLLDSQIADTASHGGFPFATTINSLENAYTSGTGGAGPTKYAQTAGAVASELTQVFRGSGGAEADVKRYLDELSTNASAEQKKAAVANIAGLLQSRLEAIGDQYKQGMGKTIDPLTLLNPHAKQVMARLGGGTAPASGNAPQATQYATNPKTGARVMLVGGKWVPAK